jgi:hypothetical protein
MAMPPGIAIEVRNSITRAPCTMRRFLAAVRILWAYAP